MIRGLAGKRVVITGASGFIGANLAIALADAGARIHAVVRPRSDRWRLTPLEGRIALHALDVQDPVAISSLMREAQPELIFHLATYRAAGADDYRAAYATNTTGLLNLLEAVPRSLEKFVHFGSSTEYGPSAVPMNEDMPLSPTTVHGVTKAAAAMLARQYARAQSLPLVILRLFHVFGPGDRPTRFIPQVVNAASSGGLLRLTAPGLKHDWTYVSDVIDAAAAAARTPLDPGETINIAAGTDWTNEEIVAAVERIHGCAIRLDPRPLAPRPWDTSRWVADVTRASRLLNWRPRYSLEAGLLKTIEWHRSHAEARRA